MWWFNKVKRTEIWDEAIASPIGDIDAAHRIRVICRSAADSARAVGSFADRAENEKKKSDIRQNQRESERYERAAKAAMEIAMKVSDELLRDAAVRQIVELCLKANDTRTARPLFRAIHAKSIIEDVLQAHPSLRGE